MKASARGRFTAAAAAGTLSTRRSWLSITLVLTVVDIEATVCFYEKLGMRGETFGDGRVALRFGEQKINLHQRGAEISPNAAHASPGSADLCFLVADPVEDVLVALGRAGIAIEEDRFCARARPRSSPPFTSAILTAIWSTYPVPRTMGDSPNTGGRSRPCVLLAGLAASARL